MLEINIKTQPDEVTCGPTSLHAVYRYYNDNIPLEQVTREVEMVPSGGTIAPLLAKHALKRGYRAIIYTYDVRLFDPTWFKKNSGAIIKEKLKKQIEMHPAGKHIHEASKAYVDFIESGGKVHFKDLTVGLLKHYFKDNKPIITGLSATYLYESPRERWTGKNAVYDDIAGVPTGHFVVLCGYDYKRRHVIVADPHRENPISNDNYYKVRIHRLINAIMLGVITYDANLLIVYR